MDVAEMRMLRQICSKTRQDKIRNERFQKHLGVASIGNKIRETHLIVWACPTQADNGANKENFGYKG